MSSLSQILSNDQDPLRRELVGPELLADCLAHCFALGTLGLAAPLLGSDPRIAMRSRLPRLCPGPYAGYAADYQAPAVAAAAAGHRHPQRPAASVGTRSFPAQIVGALRMLSPRFDASLTA